MEVLRTCIIYIHHVLGFIDKIAAISINSFSWLTG